MTLLRRSWIPHPLTLKAAAVGVENTGDFPVRGNPLGRSDIDVKSAGETLFFGGILWDTRRGHPLRQGAHCVA